MVVRKIHDPGDPMTIRATPYVELDRPAFEEFTRARTGLVEALGIEERFNMLIENYAEFESELLQQGLYNMMFEDSEWSRMANVIHTFSRRLNNLLSTCRLYLDQIPGALNRMYKDDPHLVDAFKQACREEYDTVFSYRVMEAIRNYAQHRNLPVSRLSIHNTDFPGHEKTLNHHVVIPSLDLEKLRSDPQFKRSILRELDATGNQYIDVRMLVRKYIEALGRVHSNLQEAISTDLSTWDTLMEMLRNQFEKMWDGEPRSYVIVVCRGSDGDVSEEGFVVEEAVKRRISLSRRNRYVTSYSRQVVSNFAGTST